MKNEETVKNWIFLAEGDLKTSEDELQMKNVVTNTVCFHAQQCVEKYLKAYLSLVNQPFGKTHDIAELIELCKKYDEDFEYLYQIKANKLTRYAVETRYPDDFYIPTIDEAKESVEIAILAKEFIKRKVNDKQKELKNDKGNNNAKTR
ncbi:HEPN domain-containing protein [bacterium]|nr:HEPN domain-containing protein [bacterium]